MTDFPPFIRGLPAIDVPFDGVIGFLMQGESQQVAFLEFERDTEVPEHSHNAQWELVINGEVELKMGGRAVVYRTGQSFYIPPGEAHGASVRAGYRSIVFFDQADRYQTRG